MASDRTQRRIERLLDQIDQAEQAEDWNHVSTLAKNVLDVAPENEEARAYLAAEERAVEESSAPAAHIEAEPAGSQTSSPPGMARDTPSSFANGRYQVKRFLGEGGKKLVYAAHDSLLDRDIPHAVGRHLLRWQP